MRNGNGRGSGKRWLLIVLLILGVYWLINDSYRDGYTDALVQTGQVANARYYRGGPHFPWGLLFVGGIGYIAWRKGAFDRFGGPGGPFGSGQRGIQQYGAGYDARFGQEQGYGPAFRGPRAFFDEWHRQSHEASGTWDHQPAAQAAPAASPRTENGHGEPPATMSQTPPPPPPAPDYWASMAQAAGAADTPGATTPGAQGSPAAGSAGRSDAPGGGPTLERW
ncbi:MAG: hypothetical protein IT338_12230 [Thermomicrobiales bacterium]|nr:hypothetical protein [Thermomicrobiales bacterium]